MEEIAPQHAASPPVRMRFTGAQADLFRILLRGSLLQIPTFGFYRFWLTTDIRRHMWTHTMIGDDGFEYVGRARELLIGFLIAMAILVPIYIGYFLLALEAERLQAFASVPLVVILYVLGYYALYRARRYRATRTIFRGIRFWMSGSGWAYAGRAALWDLATLASLGAAFPWRNAALERYKMRHTRFGSINGDFVATGGMLFRRAAWLWMIGLPLTLAAGGAAIAGNWAVVVGLVLLLVIPVLVAFPLYRAIELRWWLDGVRFGKVTAESNLRIGAVYRCYAMTLLIWTAYSIGGGIVIALLLAMLAGLGLVVVGAGGWSFETIPEAASIPMAVTGGVMAAVIYIAFLLGFDIIRRLFLDRGIWAAAAASVTLTHLEALDDVVATGGEVTDGVGEGLLDALDLGGGF